jgi:hypothetical protein
MTDGEELVEGIAYLREHCEKIGREQMPEVFLGSIRQPGEPLDAQLILDKLGRFREMGINGAVTHIEGRTRAEWCDNAEWFGTEILAKLD